MSTHPIARIRLEPAAQFAVGMALIVGIAARIAAVARLGPHVDEAASVMAAIQTAAHGVPRLPSGILYTQGLAQSYLLAPLAAMGWLGAGLVLPRMLSLAAGVLTLLLAFVLGRRTLQTPFGLGLFVWFVALDPGLVQWSGHVRPYALVALATMGVVLGFVDVLERGVRPGNAALLALAFGFGVFTHITTVLLWPGLALAMAVRLGFRRETWPRWGLLFALLWFPLAFQGVNALFAVSSRGAAGELPVKFVGDHLIDLERGGTPRISGWRMMYSGSQLSDVMPVFVGGSVGFLLARDHRSARALLPIYAAPLIALSLLVTEQQGRYLLNIAALGWWIIAAAAELAWADGTRWSRGLGGALGVLGLIAVGTGVGNRWLSPEIDPNYQRAIAYMLENTARGERPVVFSALTPVVWVAARDGVDLRFLAGPENAIRSERYTLLRPEGPVDWWAGVPAVASVKDLCASFAEAEGAWAIYDGERMAMPNYGFAGPFASVIRGSTRVVWQRPSVALVSRVKPVREWTNEAARLCNINPPASRGGWRASEG